MVETNPVHPDLRKEVRRGVNGTTDVEIKPTDGSRDGLIRLHSGTLHLSHRDGEYSVVGVSDMNDYNLIHVERDD